MDYKSVVGSHSRHKQCLILTIHGFLCAYTQNVSRFEGSAITSAKGYYWVVFDSLHTMARLDTRFDFRGDGNMLVPEEDVEADSQYEASN